jgi:hypothetical protein
MTLVVSRGMLSPPTVNLAVSVLTLVVVWTRDTTQLLLVVKIVSFIFYDN